MLFRFINRLYLNSLKPVGMSRPRFSLCTVCFCHCLFAADNDDQLSTPSPPPLTTGTGSRPASGCSERYEVAASLSPSSSTRSDLADRGSQPPSPVPASTNDNDEEHQQHEEDTATDTWFKNFNNRKIKTDAWFKDRSGYSANWDFFADVMYYDVT